MASGAMALDFHTRGQIQVWGGQLRKHQSDQEGGTDIGDVRVAWAKYDQVLTDRRGRNWAQLLEDLKDGRGIILQGDYDVLTGSDTCMGSFNDDHAIYLNPEFFDGGKEVAVADPLCKGFKRIKLSTLRAYAEKLGTRVYGRKGPILYGATKALPVQAPTPPPPPPAPLGGNEMIVGEGVVRTSDKYVAVKKGAKVYSDPACKTALTTMSHDASLDYMGTVPGNTVCWAIEVATGKVVKGKLLPVIAYVKRTDVGVPTARPTSGPTYTQAQLNAAVAAAVAETKKSAKAVTSVVFDG
jgi:hypothetical protein